MSKLGRELADKARRLLDPGARASVGVLKPDPTTINPDYQPVLPGLATNAPGDAEPPGTEPLRERISVRYARRGDTVPAPFAPLAGAVHVPDAAPSSLSSSDANLTSTAPPARESDPYELTADRRLITGLTRAGATMLGQANNPGLDALAANDDLPIREAKARRSDAHERALDDPKSAESAMARDIVGRALPEAKNTPWYATLTARGAEENPMLKVLLSARPPVENDPMTARKQTEVERHNRAMENIDRLKEDVVLQRGGLPKGINLLALSQQLDTNGRGAGQLAKVQERLNAADRLVALIRSSNGDIQNLTKQQVREAATATAAIIGGAGRATALRQVEEMVPKSYRGDINGWLQKLANEPIGADQQAFLQNMLGVAERESKVGHEQLRQARMERLPAFAGLRAQDPAGVDAVLKSHDIDPGSLDERLLPRPSGAAQAPTMASGTGTIRVRRKSDGKVRDLAPDVARQVLEDARYEAVQ